MVVYTQFKIVWRFLSSLSTSEKLSLTQLDFFAMFLLSTEIFELVTKSESLKI